MAGTAHESAETYANADTDTDTATATAKAGAVDGVDRDRVV